MYNQFREFMYWNLEDTPSLSDKIHKSLLWMNTISPAVSIAPQFIGLNIATGPWTSNARTDLVAKGEDAANEE